MEAGGPCVQERPSQIKALGLHVRDRTNQPDALIGCLSPTRLVDSPTTDTTQATINVAKMPISPSLATLVALAIFRLGKRFKGLGK